MSGLLGLASSGSHGVGDRDDWEGAKPSSPSALRAKVNAAWSLVDHA